MTGFSASTAACFTDVDLSPKRTKMIVAKRISIRRMLKQIWKRLILLAIFAWLSVAPLIYFDLTRFAIDRSIPLVVGTAIAIFLGFRTNSAYERWWEARILWGRILEDSLNLGRLARDLIGMETDESKELVKQICIRQSAWAYTFDCMLKDLDLTSSLSHGVDPQGAKVVQRSADPACELLLLQSQSVRTAMNKKWIDSIQSNLLQETLSRLTAHMCGCNRIKNTQFPVHYTYFTKAFIWIFLLLLGFSLPSYEGFSDLHPTASYVAIPAIFLIGWVFFTVDGIGDYMQSPFENNRNVIPMKTLSRKIEIGLLMILGETELPQPLPIVDGVAW